jgi:hypothetical protein
LSVEAFHESVKDVEVTAEAARPLGVVGAVVSADVVVGVRKCRECQFCAWLTVARVRPELIAIPRSICRRFTMPPFVPWGLLSLNIYVVVAKRRRKRLGRSLPSELVRCGDFDHP